MEKLNDLTIKEFINLNSNSIPEELINYLGELESKIEDCNKQIQFLSFSIDLKDEQLFFAKELINYIDNFANKKLNSNDLTEYRIIRDESHFEL